VCVYVRMHVCMLVGASVCTLNACRCSCTHSEGCIVNKYLQASIPTDVDTVRIIFKLYTALVKF